MTFCCAFSTHCARCRLAAVHRRNASPTAAVDWFRGLREIEHRLSEVCARTQCSVNEHRLDPPRSWLTDQTEWQTFVEADLRDREQRVIDEDLVGC